MALLYTGTALATAPLTRTVPLNLTAALGATAANASFRNTGAEFLAVSTGATPVTLTEWIATTIEGQPVNPVTAALATNAVTLIGPWPRVYDQPDFTVHFSFSDTTGVTAAVLQMPGLG